MTISDQYTNYYTKTVIHNKYCVKDAIKILNNTRLSLAVRNSRYPEKEDLDMEDALYLAVEVLKEWLKSIKGETRR